MLLLSLVIMIIVFSFFAFASEETVLKAKRWLKDTGKMVFMCTIMVVAFMLMIFYSMPAKGESIWLSEVEVYEYEEEETEEPGVYLISFEFNGEILSFFWEEEEIEQTEYEEIEEDTWEEYEVRIESRYEGEVPEYKFKVFIKDDTVIDAYRP